MRQRIINILLYTIKVEIVLTSKLEVDPLGEEGKEEKIGRKEIKIKNFSKFFANWTI